MDPPQKLLGVQEFEKIKSTQCKSMISGSCPKHIIEVKSYSYELCLSIQLWLTSLQEHFAWLWRNCFVCTWISTQLKLHSFSNLEFQILFWRWHTWRNLSQDKSRTDSYELPKKFEMKNPVDIWLLINLWRVELKILSDKSKSQKPGIPYSQLQYNL